MKNMINDFFKGLRDVLDDKQSNKFQKKVYYKGRTTGIVIILIISFSFSIATYFTHPEHRWVIKWITDPHESVIVKFEKLDDYLYIPYQ